MAEFIIELPTEKYSLEKIINPSQIKGTIVRCKDCVNRRVCVIAKKHDGFTDNKFGPDWFCADGENKKAD